ncbi:uncharacterized protein TOT_040000840 [Theileria orientalis strain Shintoku]|uniref:S5 DRBM domain-containing protein n=1 Tax=Theileria orientalis strain Shintoku TaxID=869250 RepID=J7M8P9_THEOR|nr:uncharacterized protein TOT_040000840 [Theileria orientalis strain Shintoku]BAM42473.1 uncharacterized protein TOT_040000840 [Theileria orientalis strain Shintoku]|eukprot:XP_009692774.1 uncharacterized protein TOT_040000840 [Theileria orientalis strain Shintoku]
MYTKVNLINIRRIHTGHVKKVLNSNIGALWKVYEKKIGDQRERWDRNNVEVKYEKDKLTRELMAAKRELLGVFSLREATQMLDSNQENEKYNRENVNEARRIYGILRPEAQSFFETGLYGENQPVFTSSSYTLAVTSILNSMTEDLYKLCEYLGIEDGLPERSHTSYKKIFESLENFFKLRRDGNDADEWIKRVWEKLRPHLTEELEEITNEEMSTWLKSHLRRVENNKKSQEKDDNEWYDFTRDILYDSMPYSEKVAIEDKIGYPLEEASEYLSRLLSLLKDGNVENLDELIESLKGLGLKEWFKLKPNEIEERLFGRPEEVPDKLDSKREDKELGYLLIETVSRNMEHLLDIESYSPRSILSTISKNLKTSLFEASENKWLPSQYIKEIIERVCNNRSDEVELKEYVETPLKQMLLSDYKYSQQIGPIIMTKQSNRKNWKWVAPSVDGIFDTNRNMYIRNKSNLDPQMRLDNLKSYIVSRRRMRSMTKEGRVYFIRVVVAIGDGNGYFGMGIGYGNDINSAKNSGIENGLKNMYFIDYDPFESLTTPVQGKEYGSRCVIEGREMSKGVKSNRKFLPLVYLMGLDNVKFKLRGTNSWVTRIRSIRKALEAIMSRRTIGRMLGKRYAEVSAPGDDTIHWSDEWFNPILKEYQSKINKLKRMRFKFSRKNRYKYNILVPSDVKSVVPSYNRRMMNKALKTEKE